MEDYPMNNSNKTDKYDCSDDKLSDSSVDTLANDFDEDIRLEEADDSSTSSDEFTVRRMRKKIDLYYSDENQENEMPRSNTSKHTKLRPYYDSSEKYQDASRLLRSKVNEEDEYFYNPDDDTNRVILKTIMVGSDFQAQVPESLCKYDDARPYENEDKLIWDPNAIDPESVENYLKTAASLNRPIIPIGKHLRDNEQALYLLQQCGHNVEEALRRLRMNVSLYNDNMSPWSEEECRNFEAGVRIFGKNFYLTQQNKVRTRSVGELVQFYYLWKKSERHDIFANKVRLEKKKYALHPGITDFMDRFLEDHDVRDRSSSPPVEENKPMESQNIRLKNDKI